MSDQLTILKEEMQALSADLTRKYEALGMRASGQWEREKGVEVESQGTRIKGRIIGMHYTIQLQLGRKPGKFPPIRSIAQWIEDKGIASDIPIRSLAFLIARKIAEEGTRYFQQGGTDLVDGVVTPERIEAIIQRVGMVNVNAMVDGFVNELKQVAA